MSVTGHKGVDGPYPAPVVLPEQHVRAEWIDYNGHMNVAYYTIAFDLALDAFLEQWLGIGETWVATARQGPYVLQSHVHYLAELLEGAAFRVHLLLLAADVKRMHLSVQMIRSSDQAIAATQELVLINVDHESRRAAPYPDWAAARMMRMVADHADAPRPPQTGQPIGLRGKG